MTHLHIAYVADRMNVKMKNVDYTCMTDAIDVFQVIREDVQAQTFPRFIG